MLFNVTSFSEYSSVFDNASFESIKYENYRKGKKKKNKKRRKMKKSRENLLERLNSNKDKKRRKNKKCKKCPRRKKVRQKLFRLEPTTIRHIIERVAEEALQKGAGSMDFGIDYNPFDTIKGSSRSLISSRTDDGKPNIFSLLFVY